MDVLPGELIAHLCSWLPVRELKSLRLCCKSYADIGRTFLFQNFEFRLWSSYHRLYQLEHLAANPDIASKLQSIRFESGIQLEYADYRYWHAITSQESYDRWVRGLGARGATKDEYEAFHRDLQRRFTPDMPIRYDLYRWHLDQEAALVADSRSRVMLQRIFEQLSEHCQYLKFTLAMVEPKIRLEDVERFESSMYRHEWPKDIDPRRRVADRRKHCLDHFINFLRAVSLSRGSTIDLTAIDMPHELLSLETHLASTVIDSIFRNLHKANITIGSFPHSDWLSRGGVLDIYRNGLNPAARRLRQLLSLPASLESLRLEFPNGKEAEYSFDLFDRTNIERFPRIWTPHLRTMSLCRFQCTWYDLRALLAEGKNLESLVLSHCRLETGSFVDLLHFLSGMKLSEARVEGVWYCDEDAGEWHSHTSADFNTCYAKTTYEGPFARNGLRSRIEEFLLSGGECPLPRWTPDGREEDIWDLKGDTSVHYLPGLPRH